MSRPGRRLTAWLVACVGSAALAACSSSAHRPHAMPCSWPATDTPSADGIALGLTAFSYNRLLAFDTRTGALVGDCMTSESDSVGGYRLDGFRAGNGVATTRGLQYLLPPVAGARITAMPDNTSTQHSAGERVVDQGGVRDLRTGRHHTLRFKGWLVASVIGRRLLLTRYEQYGIATDSAEWCLLPDSGASQRACAPVPGTRGAGMPEVAPSGAVAWTPLAGRPLSIGSVRGYAATDGRTGISAWAPAGGGFGTLVSADQHTVVFPQGLPQFDTTGNLYWANVRVGGATLTATLHKSAYRDLHSAAGILLDAGSMAGAFGAGDGLVVAERDGRVYRFDAGTEPQLVTRLRLPAGKPGTELGYLLTWPTGRSQT